MGLAGFPNGDITRIVSPTPKPYLSRAFIRQTWGLARNSERVEGEAAAGGHGFMLGDGKLNPVAERILETYYAVRRARMFTLTLDYQLAVNPGNNKDRGPVSIWAFRLHWEI